MYILGHSLVRLLIHSHRSLICSLRTARFNRALRCAHSFAHALTLELMGKRFTCLWIELNRRSPSKVAVTNASHKQGATALFRTEKTVVTHKYHFRLHNRNLYDRIRTQCTCLRVKNRKKIRKNSVSTSTSFSTPENSLKMPLQVRTSLYDWKPLWL